MKGRRTGAVCTPRFGLSQGIPTHRKCPPSDETRWPGPGKAAGWVALGSPSEAAYSLSHTRLRPAFVLLQKAEGSLCRKTSPHTHNFTSTFEGILGSDGPGLEWVHL